MGKDQVVVEVDLLVKTQVFPALALKDALPCSSLQQLKAKPVIQALLDIFVDAGLKVQLGYSVATGDISLTFPFPAPSQVVNPKHVIIWAMLSLLPNQADLERDWQSLHASKEQASLANRALQCFTQQTHIGLVKRRLDFRCGVVCVLDAFSQQWTNVRSGQLFSDNKRPLFVYSPAYSRITGSEAGLYSAETLLSQQTTLTEEIISDFWGHFHKARYYPDPTLKEHVDSLLLSIFAQPSPSASFHPATSIRLYLHGLAGIGKSTFVTHFANALRKTVHTWYEPEKACSLVRVPLNAVSADKLRQILYVKGLSDWSIERIIEQSVSKGGLSECPAAPIEPIVKLITTLIDTLAGRYPEFRTHVICLYTSNYPCEEPLGLNVVHVQPPSPESQTSWAQRELTDLAKAVGLNVTVSGSPTFTEDFRLLQQWRLTLGNLFAAHLLRLLHPDHLPSLLLPDFLANPLPLSNAEPLPVNLVQTDSATEIHCGEFPPLRLLTSNQYFHYLPVSPVPQLAAIGLSVEEQGRLSTILSLLGQLTPAVLVVSGPEEKRLSFNLAVTSWLRDSIPAVFRTVSAQTEDDREEIFGNPQAATLTGLVGFMDEITNPIYKRNDFAVISVTASEEGQFMLRDLLEQSKSRTHRNIIHKERTVFLVMLTGPCSPQLRSRAHYFSEL